MDEARINLIFGLLNSGSFESQQNINTVMVSSIFFLFIIVSKTCKGHNVINKYDN